MSEKNRVRRNRLVAPRVIPRRNYDEETFKTRFVIRIMRRKPLAKKKKGKKKR